MAEPIRVIQVFHGMDCGGAENMIMNLYRNIDRNKIQFDFLVHTKKKCFFDDEIKSLGGRIFHVPYYNVRNHFKYKKLLDNFFKKHPEIKIVHGHLGSCAHIYLSIAKSYGCFTIAHSHNTLPTNKSFKNFLYRIFTLKTRKTADYFMACGKQAGLDRFGEKIVNSKKFCVLNNAIDAKKFIYNEQTRNKMREQLGVSNNFVIGHIGRFDYQKNHKFLINVFYEVQKQNSNARLLLVGDGDLRPDIEKQIEFLGITDKVIMTGVRSDVPDLLQAMDCFVFPSHYEGLGIVAVEAQAAGLPTICSSAVPDEAKVTELFQSIFLDDSIKVWVDVITRNSKGYVRKNKYDQICDCKYDIRDTVRNLREFYINQRGK